MGMKIRYNWSNYPLLVKKTIGTLVWMPLNWFVWGWVYPALSQKKVADERLCSWRHWFVSIGGARERDRASARSPQISTGLSQNFHGICMFHQWKWAAAAAIYGEGSNLRRTSIDSRWAFITVKSRRSSISHILSVRHSQPHPNRFWRHPYKSSGTLLH